MKTKYIRNFSIIAHIDHGKSTLADRLLEHTGTIAPKEMLDQVLDDMDLERERGITIKAHAVKLNYKAQDGNLYELNLIDTPGHVDFTYEVSRSLAACEGALLVIDAAQGVEAQTMANLYLALENDLAVIPVINKIDLPGADPERVKHQLQEVLGLESGDAVLASAKQGIGTQAVLEAVVKHVPPPTGEADQPLKALIFDSFFDSYQGVVVYIRLLEGRVHAGMRIRLMSNNRVYEVQRVGIFAPKMLPVDELSAGDVGYFTASIKNIHHVQVGDTVTEEARPTARPLPGFKQVKPMVFAGLYPTDSSYYEPLRGALDKLSLNDTSFSFEPENSQALGFGFRCGFLGLLHMEIIQERLEREFDLSLIITAPTVVYQVTKRNGERLRLDNPSHLPPPQEIAQIEEPIVEATIIVPAEFLGGVLQLLQEKRGEQKSFEYLDDKTVLINYRLPLNEIVSDFYDRLKSVSRGYASFDYELAGFAPSSLVKLDMLVNGQVVDALSTIVHKDKAYYHGRRLAERLKQIIPRQLFVVIIQCAIGNKVIARETIRPLRKDVIAKCYGGDVTRKRKLLEKQKSGKRRMKQLGRVEIPQEAFMAVLKMD
jgi:GTP-binding protein LepA